MPEKKPPRNGRPPSILTLTHKDRVFLHLALKVGEEAAACELNIEHDYARKLVNRKVVRDYLESYRMMLLKHLAAYEMSQILKFPVTRDDLIGRLFTLSNFAPQETNGTIDGQVKAIQGIATLLGLEFTQRDADNFFKGKSVDQIRNFAKYGDFEKPKEEDALPGKDSPAGG